MTIKRKQDPEAVKQDILRVAKSEFAKNGLSGARVDEIARQTQTSKRMIYYYFKDKNTLYQTVLEEAYREVRAGEQALNIDDLPPKEALAKLVAFTFDHHLENPDFIRLVMIENIHHGQFLRDSDILQNVNRAAIDRVSDIYNKGVASGDFRAGISPLEIHWQISALSFFNVSNRTTFSLSFGEDLMESLGLDTLRQHVSEAIVRYVSKTE